MKLLYEVLNDASRNEFNRLQQLGFRGFSPLEPRRSNPLDRYQLPEFVFNKKNNQWIERL